MSARCRMIMLAVIFMVSFLGCLMAQLYFQSRVLNKLRRGEPLTCLDSAFCDVSRVTVISAPSKREE